MSRQKINLIGETFTRLTVIDIDKIKTAQKKKTYYICQCECGNIVSVASSQLLNRHTKSCGCLQKESVNRLNKDKKKYNKYDLTSQSFGICYASNTEKEILFDKEDYELIKDYCWRVDSHGYVVTSIKNESTGKYNKIIKLHHLLSPYLNNYVVDHKNGNKLDNQKHNLRICLQSDNTKNHTTHKTSTTGVSGVTWNKKNQNWRVRIGTNISVGSFANFEDAVNARKSAEEKYFGEYSYDNSRQI